MLRRMLQALCATILLLGIYAQFQVSEAVTSPPPAPKSCGREIDISEVLPTLAALRVDERPQQLADWAMQGTLLSCDLPDTVVRDALYDQTPFRLPLFEEVYSFAYGRGRVTTLDEDKTWMWVSSAEPHPRAVIGRLADQARMAGGQKPRRVKIHYYATDLTAGVIRVERTEQLDGEVLFTADYGYYEQRVNGSEDLAQVLQKIDDVTYVTTDSPMVIGGRTLAIPFKAKMTLEDVAALYQAIVKLAAQREKVHTELGDAQRPILDAFNKLIDIANSRVYESDITDQFNRQLTLVGRLVGARSGDRLGEGQDPEPHIEALRPLVKERMAAHAQTRFEALSNAGKVAPDYPGFSLDPQWDTATLARDLRLLLSTPQALITRARSIFAAAQGRQDDEAARPRAVWAAKSIESEFVDKATFVLSREHRAQIGQIIARLGATRRLESDKSQIVPLQILKAQVRSSLAKLPPPRMTVKIINTSDGKQDLALVPDASPSSDYTRLSQLNALLGFLFAENEVQCARYDGPLQGTAVGMNLFYTDLLAKVWASVDWHRSAPTEAVLGLPTFPSIGTLIEPQYEAEESALSSTRVWFGPKDGTFAIDSEHILFAPISTRVYAAGSNPTDPRKESVPSESGRRVLLWWDRNFEAIADYEPHFHRQNQIMKWSVITGWLHEHGRLSDLVNVPVSHKDRFDRWLANAPDLRFREDVRFTPERKWLGGTECIERLHSYSFDKFDGSWYVEGGVSLSNELTLKTASRIGQELPNSTRKAGLLWAQSSKEGLTTSFGTRFTLPKLEGRVETVVANTGRMRQGPIQLRPAYLESKIGDGRFAIQSSEGSLAGWRLEPQGTRLRMRGSSPLIEVNNRHAIKSPSLIDIFSREERIASASDGETFTIEGSSGFRYFRRSLGSDGRPQWSELVWRERPPGGSSKGLTLGEQGSRELIATPVEATHAEAALGEQGWMRIKSGYGNAPTVSFTKAEPPATAPIVTMHTDLPGLKTVEGRLAQDGSLYVRRPPGGPEVQGTFNALVHREMISSADLSALGKQQSGAALELRALSQRRSVGDRVNGWAQRGELRELKGELVNAARQGKLSEALGALKDLSAQPGATSGDGFMALARNRDPAALAVLNARRGEVAGLSKEVAATASLRQIGPRQLSSVKLDGKMLQAAVRKGDAVRSAKQGEATMMFGRDMLNQGPLHDNPGALLAEVERNPRVIVMKVDAEHLGSFTPDLVQTPTKDFVRQPVSTEAATALRSRTPSWPRTPSLGRSQPTFLVQQCADDNGDGTLDDSERQLCICDANRDRALSAPEREHCPLK